MRHPSNEIANWKEKLHKHVRETERGNYMLTSSLKINCISTYSAITTLDVEKGLRVAIKYCMRRQEQKLVASTSNKKPKFTIAAYGGSEMVMFLCYIHEFPPLQFDKGHWAIYTETDCSSCHYGDWTILTQLTDTEPTFAVLVHWEYYK